MHAYFSDSFFSRLSVLNIFGPRCFSVVSLSEILNTKRTMGTRHKHKTKYHFFLSPLQYIAQYVFSSKMDRPDNSNTDTHLVAIAKCKLCQTYTDKLFTRTHCKSDKSLRELNNYSMVKLFFDSITTLFPHSGVRKSKTSRRAINLSTFYFRLFFPLRFFWEIDSAFLYFNLHFLIFLFFWCLHMNVLWL